MATKFRNESGESSRLSMALRMIDRNTPKAVLSYLSYLMKENNGAEGARQAIEEQKIFSESEKAELGKLLDTFSSDLQPIAQSYDEQTLKDVMFRFEQKGRGEDFLTPDVVSRIILALTDKKNCKKVMHYGSKNADFLIEARKALPEAELLGLEQSKSALMVSKIRSLVSGSDISFNRNEWIEEIASDNKYDLMFNDSFAATLPPELINCFKDLSSKLNISCRKSASDWMLTTLLLPHLEKGGKIVKIFASNPLWNIPESELREAYIKRGWIESVIRLPKRSYEPATSIDTYLVVIGDNQSDEIQMIDLMGRDENRDLSKLNLNDLPKLLSEENGENNKKVPVSEILANNSNLLPEKYLYPVPVPENAVPLKNLVKKFIRGTQISVTDLKEITSYQKTELVMLKASSIQNGQIDYDNVDYLEELPERFKKATVSPSDMIVTRIGNPFKTAVVTETDDLTLVLGGNLFAFIPDTSKIDPWFLQAYFESEQGNAAINEISNGALKSISIPFLEDLMVPCPPMDEQKKIAREYREVSDKLIEAQNTLEQLKQELKKVYEKGGE